MSSTPRDRARDRYVVASQQLLALALILAVLTPAARTISMDVRPAGPAGSGTGGAGSAHLRSAAVPATVPSAPVEPSVEEYPLTAPAGARVAPGTLRATARRTATGGQRLTSDPVPVVGYGTVGVTWQHGTALEEDQIGVEARTFQDGAWSGWTEVAYHDHHGPDPDSPEARRARPGTEPLLVGEVDRVQVRIATDEAAPADLRLAVIDPGQATSTARQLPDIDTDELDGSSDGSGADSSDGSEGTGDEAALDLQAAVTAPKPRIFSRAQWGANERMRDGSPSYHEVHAGFVHHTVNANDYSRAEVPGIIRGIYAYHTQSQGWSDVGYNFLVDRFGRIWEGRAGGVDRPVVGAHTLGYNDNSFAMSAIGNFETAYPRPAMLQAYGALFAWKLGLHGVDAGDTSQYVTSRTFRAINGHRDAGSTACPGRHLYAKVPRIRELANAAQQGWDGRELESDLVGRPRPDLVVRRASDGKVFVLPIKYRGGYRLGAPVDTGINARGATAIFKAGDWDRDGEGDIIVRKNGNLYLHRGLGAGRFGPAIQMASGFGKVKKMAAVGDFTGDGRPDLLGQPRGGGMRIYPGNGNTGLRASYAAYSAVTGDRQIAVGRWDGDGAPDTILRTATELVLYPGNGPGGLTGRRTLSLGIQRYNWIVGVSDVDVTGHADLVARSRADGRMWVIPGTTSGFRTRVPLAGSTQQYDLVG